MIERDREDAAVAVVPEGVGRPFESKPLDEGEDRLAADGAEDPVEVKGRERGDPGEALEGEVLGQVGGGVVDDQVHALLVFQAVEVHGPGHRLRCDLPIFRRTRRAQHGGHTAGAHTAGAI